MNYLDCRLLKLNNCFIIVICTLQLYCFAFIVGDIDRNFALQNLDAVELEKTANSLLQDSDLSDVLSKIPDDTFDLLSECALITNFLV